MQDLQPGIYSAFFEATFKSSPNALVIRLGAKIEETEGSGIELAKVKRIIELHGGKIWFESEGKGKGTIFYFTLEKTRVIN